VVGVDLVLVKSRDAATVDFAEPTRRSGVLTAMDSRYASRQRPRWGTLLLVVLLHLAALAALVRAFAPDFTAGVVERTASLVAVTITAPPDPPVAPEAGAAGAEAPEAVAREVAAPEARLPRPSAAPPAAATGSETVSGTGEQGAGSGGGGAGTGPGSNGATSGQGGGARPLELISGRIDDARDYPTPPGGRRVRRGHDVVIELTVGPDGRVNACRVTDPSPDPEADAITCRLATARFVFRPRLNSAGEPVVGTYRWRQRWF
jgi:protein TonB